MEDNAVGTAATRFTVLVGGNRGRKNNVFEGIHVESVGCDCVVAVMRTESIFNFWLAFYATADALTVGLPY